MNLPANSFNMFKLSINSKTGFVQFDSSITPPVDLNVALVGNLYQFFGCPATGFNATTVFGKSILSINYY